MLRHAWFIAVKDLRLFARDRFALLFALLFPFLFATMFYFIMGGVGAGRTARVASGHRGSAGGC